MDVRQRHELATNVRRTSQQPTGPLFRAERARVEQHCRLRAEQDLSRLGGALHLDRPAGGGAGDQKLAMRGSDQEEVEAARVEAGVHSQLDGAHRGMRAADRTERASHLECRPCRPRCVTLIVVEEKERVTAELEQPAALGVRDVEQRLEGRVHHFGDLFRTCPALARKAFGHRGEAGDVDERQGSLELEPVPLGTVLEPLQGEPRNERDEVVRGPRGCIRRGHRMILN